MNSLFALGRPAQSLQEDPISRNVSGRFGFAKFALAATVALTLICNGLSGYAQGLFAGVTGIETQPANGKVPQTIRFFADLPFQYQKQVLNEDQVLFRLYNARLSDGVVANDGLINMSPAGAVETAMFKAVNEPGAIYEEIVLSGKGLGKQNLLILGATEMGVTATMATGQHQKPEKTSRKKAEKPLVVFPEVEPSENRTSPDQGGMAAMAVLAGDAQKQHPGISPDSALPRIEIGGASAPVTSFSELQDTARNLNTALMPESATHTGNAPRTIEMPKSTGKKQAAPAIAEVSNLTMHQKAMAQAQADYPTIAALQSNPNYPQPSGFYQPAEPGYTADQVYQAGFQAGMNGMGFPGAITGMQAAAPEEEPLPPEPLMALPRYRGGAKPIQATTYDNKGRPIVLKPLNNTGHEVDLQTGSSGYNTLFQADSPSTGNSAVSRLMIRALEHYKKEDFTTALSQINEALQVDQANPELYAALGEIQMKRHAVQEAAKAYEKATGLSPNKYDQRYAQALILAGQRKEAVSVLEDLFKRKPNQAKVAFMLGTLHEEMGNTEKALPYLEKAAQLNPGSADVHYNLGLAYELLGQAEEAQRAYEKTLNLNPAADDAIRALERVKS